MAPFQWLNCDGERTMAIPLSKSQCCHSTARVCVSVCVSGGVPDYRDEWMLSVAQGEGNTFHSSYQFWTSLASTRFLSVSSHVQKVELWLELN